jgi:hypothetical protein
MIKRLHSVLLSVWAPHRQPSMWRSLLSAARLRDGAHSAVGGLMVVVRGVDLVVVLDIEIAASVDIGCGKA